MRWFPWATGAAGLLGAVAGVIFPGRSLGHTSDIYSAYMTPPANVSGQDATLTCGWHDSAGCVYAGSTALNALDWNNGISPFNGDVYFRGYFALLNHPTDFLLTGMTKDIFTGIGGCDVAAVEVWETSVNKKRFRVDYVHTTLTNPPTTFNIKTADNFGNYNNVVIGTTANDSMNCDWTGFHVHERGHKPDVPGINEVLASFTYPQGDCTPSPGCNWGTFQNNTFLNWTRVYNWTEGN